MSRHRIPALVIHPQLWDPFVVDHTQYDTTSVMATMERLYDLDALTTRDAAVNDLMHAFDAGTPR